MPSGVQLRDLIYGVRAEAGHSLKESHGVSQRDTIAWLLQRKQRTLWYAHDWPLHMFWFDLTVPAGTRYINYPVNMDPKRVNKASRKWGSEWAPLFYGITPSHYNLHDSDLDERSSPLVRWGHYYAAGMQQNQVGQIEVWPIPSEDSLIRLFGHERLPDMNADEDLCTLDSDMLVLYVSGQLLLRTEKADAQLKLNEADQMRRNLLMQTSSDRENITRYGGPTRVTDRPRRDIDYVTKRSGT